MNNKETKEALVGLLAIAGLLAEEFKDGLQATDAMSIIVKLQSNEQLKSKLLEAYNGIDQVPSELKDLDFSEGFDLVSFAIPELIKLIGSIKK